MDSLNDFFRKLLISLPNEIDLLTQITKHESDLTRKPLTQAEFQVDFQAKVNAQLLEAAAQGDIYTVKAMISAKADINTVDSLGITALMKASCEGHTPTVEYLITEGADVNTLYPSGGTALIQAAYFGHRSTVAALLKAPDILINQVDKTGESALTYAIERGYTSIVLDLLGMPGNLINQANRKGETVLMKAAYHGHMPIEAILAYPGIDINLINEEGETALMIAAFSRESAMVSALLACPDINVNLVNEEGETALMISAFFGDIAILNQLLAFPGILINQTNRFGCTALINAAARGHIEVVSALLACPNIDFNITDINGATAIIKAFEQGYRPIVTLLRNRGAVLPARLEQENAAANNINQAQSVHEVSVHLSVSRSAKNLLDQYVYTPEQLIHRINELTLWLDTYFINTAALPREYKPEWLDPAKRCVVRLNTLNFTDQRSGVSMQQALGLVWAGINNPQARGADKPVLEIQEIIDRGISFLKQLYEIQRGYNFVGDSANPVDNGLEDKPTCVSGSFNKLIGALSDAGHQGVQVIFVTSALINMQVPFLTKQAFGSLPEEERKRFAQSWEVENSETLQAECFALLKNLVSIKLHEIYDEFNSEVPNLNQVITDAAANVHHINLDAVMQIEREIIQKKEHEAQAERERHAEELARMTAMPPVRNRRETIVFSCNTRNVKRSRAAIPSERNSEEAAVIVDVVGRYPKRSTRSFRGFYPK